MKLTNTISNLTISNTQNLSVVGTSNNVCAAPRRGRKPNPAKSLPDEQTRRDLARIYLMHTGVGVLHTEDQDGRVRFRARPQIHEGPRVIDSGILQANEYTTGNVEFAVVWGAVALQSEAFLSAVNTQPDRATVGGAYAHLSWFLTGENRILSCSANMASVRTQCPDQ